MHNIMIIEKFRAKNVRHNDVDCHLTRNMSCHFNESFQAINSNSISTRNQTHKNAKTNPDMQG